MNKVNCPRKPQNTPYQIYLIMNRCLSDNTILSSLQFIGILYHPQTTLSALLIKQTCFCLFLLSNTALQLTQSNQSTLTASDTQLAEMHADMIQNTSYIAQEKEGLLNTVSEQSLSTPALRLGQLSQCHGSMKTVGLL